MTKLEKMKGQLGFLGDKLKELLDKEGDRTQEEFTEMQKLTGDVDELRKKIAEEQRLEKIKADAEKRAQELADDEKPTEKPVEERIEVQDPPGFRHFGEYLQAVAIAATPMGGSIGGKPTGMVDRRLLALKDKELRAATGAQESVPVSGGFLVGTQYATEFMTRAQNESALASRCRKLTLTSNVNSIKINGIDESSRADGSRWGGIRAYWADEAAQMTSSYPKLKQVQLTVNKLTGLFYATDELLQDAGALGDYAMSTFPREFAFKIDDEIFDGDGSGKPLGVKDCNAVVQVNKETGQAADTIVVENLAKMYMRMWNPGKSRGVFVANNDIIPQLMTLSVPVGTAGAPVFITNVQEGPVFRIFGRPVIFIEHAKTLGDAGDIMFLDLGEYMFIDKGGIQTGMSIHLRFDYNETAFRWVYRCDGQPLWTSALTPYQGSSNTVSPFIKLQARA